MPIYEYTCQECNATFEELVSLSSEATPVCPSCSSPHTKKILSASNVGRTGSGLPSCGDSCPGSPSCGAGTCCGQFS